MPDLPNAPKEILDEISEEYESTLVIPDKKPNSQWILLPVGMMGSGKSAIVGILSKYFGLVSVSTDEARMRLKDRGFSYEGAREVSQGIIKKCLESGYSVAIDANTGSEQGIEFNNRSKELFPDVRQISIHVNPPEEFVVDNLKHRHKKWLFRDGEHAMERFPIYKKNYNVPDIPFVYTFDTSKDNMPEQIDEAIVAIENMLQSN